MRTSTIAFIFAVVALFASGGVAQQITMSPAVSVPTQAEFTVDVAMATGGAAVTGVSVRMTYDPAVVRLDGIDPGAWLAAQGDQGVAYFFHDFTGEVPAGRLEFDAALLGASSAADGLVGTCRFTALSVGESPLVFVDVEVRGPDNQDLGFAHSTGDLIRIEPGELWFEPSTSVPVAPEFTVDLMIDASVWAVKGVDVVVSFDPAIVTLQDITPGAWVTGQGLLHYFYDYTEPGATTIHLSMSFLDGSGGGSGALAVCRFTAEEPGTSPLDFVTVDARDDANQPLPFEHSIGDQIIIDPAVRAEASTLSAVKVTFR